MHSNIPYLHSFHTDITTIERPTLFTFPFCYEPHSLAVAAAQELQGYLSSQKDFEHNFGLQQGQEGLVIGKMFGVLVVEDKEGNLGYLAACSGKLAGTNTHQHLIPPIFDMLDSKGFFLQEEATINALNREIEKLELNPQIENLKQQLEQEKEKTAQSLAQARQLHKANKAERKQIRTAQKALLSPKDYKIKKKI